jgi:flagellar protein FlbD
LNYRVASPRVSVQNLAAPIWQKQASVHLAEDSAFTALIGLRNRHFSLHITFVQLPALPLLIEAILPMKHAEGFSRMIELTRLNGSRLIVNCDLIKYAEASPDTMLTLITGEKLVVLEPSDEILLRTLAYRARVLAAAWPEASSSLSAKSAHDAQKALRDIEHPSSKD